MTTIGTLVVLAAIVLEVLGTAILSPKCSTKSAENNLSDENRKEVINGMFARDPFKTLKKYINYTCDVEEMASKYLTRGDSRSCPSNFTCLFFSSENGQTFADVLQGAMAFWEDNFTMTEALKFINQFGCSFTKDAPQNGFACLFKEVPPVEPAPKNDPGVKLVNCDNKLINPLSLTNRSIVVVQLFSREPFRSHTCLEERADEYFEGKGDDRNPTFLMTLLYSSGNVHRKFAEIVEDAMSQWEYRFKTKAISLTHLSCLDEVGERGWVQLRRGSSLQEVRLRLQNDRAVAVELRPLS